MKGEVQTMKHEVQPAGRITIGEDGKAVLEQHSEHVLHKEEQDTKSKDDTATQE